MSTLTWQSLFTLALYSDTDWTQEIKIKSENTEHYRRDNGLHQLLISLATPDNQSGLKKLEGKVKIGFERAEYLLT